MKKLRTIILVMLLVNLVGCGSKKVEEPDNATMKKDIQDYITEMIDEDAEVKIFEKTDSKEDDNKLVVTCNVLFGNSDEESKGDFILTYELSDGKWTLSKCRVELDDAKAANNETKEKKEQEKNSDTASEEDIEMSDELYDFTFTLDGVVYQLPFDYSQLTANGWTISSTGYSEDYMMAANSYENIYFAKNGNKVMFEPINMSGNSKKLKDCKIGGIEVENNDLVDTALFSIAKGINTESTLEEVTSAFGTASTTNKYDDYTVVRYEKDNYIEFSMYCYNENTDYNQISMRNFESDESDETEVSADVPKYLSEYAAPAELGDDFLSGNIEIAGKLYTLPAPVSEFLDDGWTIQSKSNGVGSMNTDSVTIEKDGKKLSLYIENLADYQTIPENCAVYRVYAYADDGISVKIPKGLSFDSTKADVEAAKSEEFSYYKSESSYSYSYDKYDEGYSLDIYVDAATEKISQFSVSCKIWKYE